MVCILVTTMAFGQKQDKIVVGTYNPKTGDVNLTNESLLLKQFKDYYPNGATYSNLNFHFSPDKSDVMLTWTAKDSKTGNEMGVGLVASVDSEGGVLYLASGPGISFKFTCTGEPCSSCSANISWRNRRPHVDCVCTTDGQCNMKVEFSIGVGF